MPKEKVENSRKTPRKLKRSAIPSKDVINSDSIHSEEDFAQIPKSPNGSDSDSKRSLLDIDEEPAQDFSGGMSKLIERFQSDLNKTMNAKKRKLEFFTQESTKSTTKKVLETNKMQSAERKKLIEHFQNHMFAVINQGELEMEKMKDAEEKLQKAIVQQQKHQQQIRIAHSQRWKALKSLSEEFCKGMNELEESHIEQYSEVHNELKKEMAILQKKMLMDLQQQEMMNVRKQLKQLIP